MPEFQSEKRSAKELFQGDYANEFVAIQGFIQILKDGSMDLPAFKDILKDMAADPKKGKTVRTFNEVYGLPAPEIYKKEIERLDGLVGEINICVDEILQGENDQKIDDLERLVKEALKIIKDTLKNPI